MAKCAFLKTGIQSSCGFELCQLINSGIKIPEGFSDNVEIIVLPLETEELSEREFDFLTLNHALEDDDSEDKVWQRYLTSGDTK